MSRRAALRTSAHETLAAPSNGSTRLQGWPLVVARTLTFAIVAFTVGIYLLALPRLVSQLATPCTDTNGSCIISPQQVTSLADFGITPHGLAVAVTVLTYLSIALVAGVAAVLFWRRSDDWMALLVALTLVLMPSVFTPVGQGLPRNWEGLGQVYNTATFTTLYLLMGLFPSGRFVPRWLWLPILLQLLFLNIPLEVFLPNDLDTLLAVLVILFCYSSLIAGQIYRYRRTSTPTQRQQTKWVVFGIVLTLVVNQLFWQPIIWIPALQKPDSLYPIFAAPDSALMIGILAVSFGVAILRYRLYDIDVIIRRTLIYGSLTAILAGIYIAGVVGVQAIVNTLARNPTGETSPVLVVTTTLLIAALFQPLRRRIQRFIDRRFYRSKYDTRKTLEAFSAALRQEVDLSALTGQLVEVVTETMQPEHVSLWLRDAEGRR